MLIMSDIELKKYLSIYKDLCYSHLRKTLDVNNIELCKYQLELLDNDLDCINCPVLLLCGEKDNANRKATTELHKRLKNSSYEIVENSSHEVNIDNPKKLAALLCEFLSQKQ